MSDGRVLWALVLGASSGFGEAAALALARNGYNIFGVHLDRRATLPHVEEVVAGVRQAGSEPVFFNVNAADPEKRQEVVAHMRQALDARPGTVQVLLHSLAFGALKKFVDGEDLLQQARAHNPHGRLTTPGDVAAAITVLSRPETYWITGNVISVDGGKNIVA